MSNMRTIKTLRKEHELILERTIRLREWVGGSLEAKRVEITKAVTFIDEFMGTYHHDKEEKIFFEWMNSKNIMLEQGPLGVRMCEHDLIREYVVTLQNYLSDSQKSPPWEQIKKLLNQLIVLVEENIGKENNVIFHMAHNLNEAYPGGDEFMMEKFFDLNDLNAQYAFQELL